MMKKTPHKTAAAALLALLAAPGAALACSDSPYIGTICTFAFNYCPQGFLPANGSLVQINTNQALYSLLSTTYGGDGRSTFGLPDLRGRVVVGAGQGPGLTNALWAKARGAESVMLSAMQMAPHNHPAILTGTGGGTASGNVSLPVTGSTTSVAVTGTVSANALTSQTTGASATPSATANTVGKNGLQAAFYPYSAGAAVASPSTINLTAPSTTVSGNASGNVNLAVTGVAGTVAVGSNVTQNAPVAVLDPGLGLTVCIATQGVYPMRPD